MVASSHDNEVFTITRERTASARNRLYRVLLAAHQCPFAAAQSATEVAVKARGLLERTAAAAVRFHWVIGSDGCVSLRSDDQSGPEVRLRGPRGWVWTEQAFHAARAQAAAPTNEELVDALAAQNRALDDARASLEDKVLDRTAALEAATLAAESATAAKSMFLANMSHEIRTPMNAVLGLAHLLGSTTLDARQRDYVAKIGSAGETLLGVINDILDFSKIEADQMELETISFDLDRVLDRVATVVGHAALGKQIEFVVKVGPEIPQTVLGDPLRLGQVLTNLANNAVKFTERGEVVIDLSLQPGAHGATLVIEVRDSGIGMSAEQVARLFQPFAQADETTTRRYGGTGLGLTISQRIVALMGGSIEVHSELGRGSTFRVSLPLAHVPQPEVSVVDDLSLHVLVVDDHIASRAAVCAMIEGFGATAVAAADGQLAVELALEATNMGAPFDVAIIDWSMPGMDGPETARALRAPQVLGTEVPLYLLSARDAASMPEESSQLFAATIQKPLTRDRLRQLLARRGSSSPEGGDEASSTSTQRLLGFRVLLVDDNEINRQIGRELLTQAGAVVEEAADGVEACELALANDRPRLDVILMDLQMPRMDGYDAVRRLRAERSLDSTRIYALTAHAMVEELQRCLALGMNGRVTKPIDPALFIRTVAGDEEPPPPASAPDDESNSQRVERRAFDTAAMLARLGGDLSLAVRLLRDFLESVDVDHEREACRSEPSSVLSRRVHRLRGAASNLGLDLAAAAAQELELALDADRADTEQRDAWIEALRQGLDAARDWLDAQAQSLPSSRAPGQARDWSTFAPQVLAMLQDGDPGVLDLVEEEIVILESELAGLADAFLAAVRAFDFETAAGFLASPADAS